MSELPKPGYTSHNYGDVPVATRPILLKFPSISDGRVQQQILYYRLNGGDEIAQTFNATDTQYRLEVEVGTTITSQMQHVGLDQDTQQQLTSVRGDETSFFVEPKLVDPEGDLPKPGVVAYVYDDLEEPTPPPAG